MHNTTHKPERVTTKHGFKARRVTPAQEAALDAIENEGFVFIVKLNVLNEDFNNQVVVYVATKERHLDEDRGGRPYGIITQAGELYPL